MDGNDSTRRIAGTGIIIVVICVSIVIIQSERSAATTDRQFSDWINRNDLAEFRTFLYENEIYSLDDLVHFKPAFQTQFKKASQFLESVESLRHEIALKMWVMEQGFEDTYVTKLTRHSVVGLRQLHALSDDDMMRIAADDKSLNEYKMLQKCVKKLRTYGSDVNQVEQDFLDHHKFGYVPDARSHVYSGWTVIVMVFSGLIVTFVTVWIMFINRLLSTEGPLQSLSTLSKKSLFYLSGQYDIVQNTKVTWNWEEPEVVGKTMTFSVRFFHKSTAPYPVSNKDNITVEISHAGSEVTKTMTLGGVNQEDANLLKVSFTVHKSGEYTICVMIGGRHIKGSPFTKKFEAGPIDASKTGFMNYTSTVVCTPESSYPLTIEARDSYGNIAAYKPGQNNYFKIRVAECGTNEKYFPPTQIFYNSRQKQLTMQIKMERVGCYQASVSYGDINLKNGDFNILVLSSEDHSCVEKNMNKCNNIWYKARLISCNNEKLAKPKKVYIYITPKQLKLKEYFLKIIGKRLFTYRVCPSTKFSFSGYSNQLASYVFTIDDGAQAPVVLAAKDRSIIAATFTKFLLKNIGGSETFQDKQTFFYHEVRNLHLRKSHSTTLVKIERARLLQSSYKAVKSFDVSDWCKNFEISFVGEQGLDWGGLRREWFETVCSHLFDPAMSGLFKRLSDDSQGLVHPNQSKHTEEDLKMFEFAGKVVGKCLYESARGTSLRSSYRQLVKARFSRSFLAQLIGLRVHYKYFETDDPELYKTKIKYIEENDIEGMELTFSEEEYVVGTNGNPGFVKVIDFVLNGSKQEVTNENKLQYLDHLAQYRLANAVRDQIDAFLKGLNELIPDNLLSIFDENELELLMCGMRKYSVADLKTNHVINGSTPTFRRVLEWFWTIIDGFSDEQMARLLQFTTGCSQLPPGGFAELVPKFQISPTYTYNTLPTAHTCFNNLCLPDYDCIEQFHRSLVIAINEGNTGFGLV
ncbi:apoptosis-resistant E3 ubiquitin protein ligase 1-like isoform X1 [Dreissena polymorpha]|uniref:apoptosis-resistant E3 ubiquitin protein ligase 1-like isoform X1 n=3 Tax=Dreissena polymorpha TaxID=45954 RepID=UPI002265568D|nr:apoptosis-resistant E3 ubiquitin protein ligase 1-like isoform X1 [Dreissena polymorpha]